MVYFKSFAYNLLQPTNASFGLQSQNVCPEKCLNKILAYLLGLTWNDLAFKTYFATYRNGVLGRDSSFPFPRKAPSPHSHACPKDFSSELKGLCGG